VYEKVVDREPNRVELTRRVALALPLVLAACGPKGPAAAPAEPQGPPPHLDPLTDLCAGAGLEWIITLRAREIASRADLIPAIAKVIPEERFRLFAKGHGGIDLRQLHELVIARYRGANLWLGRGLVDPSAIERAFNDRAETVDGRAIDRRPAEIAGGITRMWGRSRGARVQVATFGREGVAVESATSAPPNLSPLRIAELFAEGKLKKVQPALRTEPLRRAAEVLGDAPARGFAPGPFEGDWTSGFGGLLAACTAAALGARPETRAGKAVLACRLALLGEWKASNEAQTHLLAWLDTFAQDGLGRLLGVNRPVEPPRARAEGSDALVLEVGLDAEVVAKGLHEGVEASVQEIMGS
jgi:hypothetical protein